MAEGLFTDSLTGSFVHEMLESRIRENTNFFILDVFGLGIKYNAICKIAINITHSLSRVMQVLRLHQKRSNMMFYFSEIGVAGEPEFGCR